MLNEIEKQIEDCAGNFREIVRDHFPRVSDGLACMLLLSLVQLGEYCMSMKSTKFQKRALEFFALFRSNCWSVYVVIVVVLIKLLTIWCQ